MDCGSLTSSMPKRPREPSSTPDVAASSSSIAEPVPKADASPGKPAKTPALIVVLERACLEVGKVGKEHVLVGLT